MYCFYLYVTIVDDFGLAVTATPATVLVTQTLILIAQCFFPAILGMVPGLFR